MRESRSLLASLLWLSLLGASIANIQPIFLGALAESLPLSAQQLGFLGGAELAGGSLTSLAAAYWFPRVNLRPVVLFAIVCAISGNLLTTWVSDFPSLLALRFCSGFFGTGILYAVSIGLIGQTQNPDRLIAVAVVTQILFAAVAMLAIPQLLARWQLSGMTFGLALLFSTGLLILTRLPARAAVRAEVVAAVGPKAPQWVIPVALLAGLTIFSVGINAVWAFLERIGNTSGFAMTDIGVALAVTGLIGGLGAVLAAFLGQSLGRILPVVTAIAGLSCACLLLYMRSDWVSYFLALALFGFFWNMALPFLLGAVAAADNSGAYTVLIPAAQGGGYALGPTIAGLFIVGDAYATSALFAIGAFAVCLLVVVPVLIRLQRKALPSDPNNFK